MPRIPVGLAFALKPDVDAVQLKAIIEVLCTDICDN